VSGKPSAYVFDAYGTLFDTASAVLKNADRIGPKAQALADLWRTKQLEYTWVNSAISSPDGNPPLAPFREMTYLSLHYALEALGLDKGLAVPLLGDYASLELFPDARDTLTRLKQHGHLLAIFSNSDTDMLDDLVEGNKLIGAFDCLISVRVAGAYKPSPKVYALVEQALHIPPASIIFVSSNRWDIAGATAFGFQTAWINRAGKPDEYPNLPPHRQLTSLTGL
jgi:2-haloacid dehalogenase